MLQITGVLDNIVYGNNQTISYTYDRFERLKTKEGDTGTVTYGYDSKSNLALINDAPINTITDYIYDFANRLIGTISSSGFSTAYEYDKNSNISKVTSELEVENAVKLNTTDYDYDLDNKISNIKIEDDKYSTYNYDKLSRLNNKKINDNINTYATKYEYISNDIDTNQTNTEQEDEIINIFDDTRVKGITIPTTAGDFPQVSIITDTVFENDTLYYIYLYVDNELCDNHKIAVLFYDASNNYIFQHASFGKQNFQHSNLSSVKRISLFINQGGVESYGGKTITGIVVSKAPTSEYVPYESNFTNIFDDVKVKGITLPTVAGDFPSVSVTTNTAFENNTLYYIYLYVDNELCENHKIAVLFYDTSNNYIFQHASFGKQNFQHSNLSSVRRISFFINQGGVESYGGKKITGLVVSKVPISEDEPIIDDKPVETNKLGTSTTLLKSIQNGEDIQGRITYTYDDNGNIETITKGTEQTQKYYYDKLNQLIREDNKEIDRTIIYEYDLGGNILNKLEYDYTEEDVQTLKKVNVYEYENQNWKDQLTEYNGQPITYDEIGNPLTYYGFIYTWQNGRQLAGVNFTSALSISYKYNESGIRTEKWVNGTRTDYYLEGSKVIYEKTGNNVTYYTYDDQGQLIGLKHNDIQYYYIQNGQGDIIGILDSSLTQVVSYTYDSWGKILSITDENGDEITDEEDIGLINPYRYRSYRYDNETELYYLQSRYYNPEWGRFLNADGTFDGGHELLGHNLYAYCASNPINNRDPDGYAIISIAAVIGMAVTLVAQSIKIIAIVVGITAVAVGTGYLVAKAVSSNNNTKSNIPSNNKSPSSSTKGASNSSNTVNNTNNKTNTGNATSTKGTNKGIDIKIPKRRELPRNSIPSSEGILRNEDGTIKQRRLYGPDGRALKDTDYNHGGKHVFPHEHWWTWDNSGNSDRSGH